MTMRRGLAAVGQTLLAAGGAMAQPCEPSWEGAFGGLPYVNGEYISAAMFDDGSGPALYVGSANNDLGMGIQPGGIGRIREGRLEALPGLGFPPQNSEPASVHAFILHDDGSGPALYVGGRIWWVDGEFHQGVVRWRGAGWERVGGTIGEVYAFAEFDEDGDGPAPARLIAGGSLGQAPGQGLVQWDGVEWTDVGGGVDFPGVVYALASGDDGSGVGEALFVGGSFQSVGEVPVNAVARWDGASWTDMDGGLAPLPGSGATRVNTLTWHDDGFGRTLYAGGRIRTNVSDGPAYGMARWDGSAWKRLGLGESTEVRGAASGVINGVEELVIVGSIQVSQGAEPAQAARWTGDSFEPLPGQPRHTWDTLASPRSAGAAAIDGGVVVLGNFDTVGEDAVVRNVAVWDGDALVPYTERAGAAFFSGIGALASDAESGDLYVGGDFPAIGGRWRPYVARVDASGEWSFLGDGLNGPVVAMTVHGTGADRLVLAGGSFTASGETNLAQSIARFDAGAWSRFATLNFGEALTFATIGGDLYAGGTFSGVEGVTAPRIARWDGKSWHALGGGLSGGAAQVYAIAPWGGGLAVGGSFTNSAGTTMRSVAMWDGASWSAMGAGFNGAVRALAVFGGELYAAGDFTMSGSSPLRSVARWDGESWRALPGTFSGPIRAMQVYNDGTGEALYVGGAFGLIDFTPFRFIARWDGASWSQVDEALNGRVDAFVEHALDGGRPALMASGAFTQSSGVGAYGIAVWRGCLSVCPGDANGDQVIDMADLMIVVDAFNTSEGDPLFNAAADFDLNGAVDFEDLNRVIAGFNMGC